MYQRLNTLIIVLLFGCSQGFSQTLRTILIAHSSNPDLTYTYQRNISMMDSVLREVAKSINYEYVSIVFEYSDLTDKKLDTEILQLNVTPEDLIFFYYTGQGISQIPAQYPSILLKDKYIKLEAIHQKLSLKLPKLCISVVDCGNQKVTNHSLKIEKPLISRSIFVENDILRKLFKESSGNIIISSAKQNERAHSSTEEGSHYTIALLEALAQAENNNISISWDLLLKDAELRLQEKLSLDNKVNLQHSQWKISSQIETPVAPSKTTVNFHEMNQFMNMLADERLSYDKRERLLSTQIKKFFTSSAEANEYINTIDNNMESVPILDLLNKIMINANLIKQINVVENLSTFSEGGKYQIVTIQEIR